MDIEPCGVSNASFLKVPAGGRDGPLLFLDHLTQDPERGKVVLHLLELCQHGLAVIRGRRIVRRLILLDRCAARTHPVAASDHARKIGGLRHADLGVGLPPRVPPPRRPDGAPATLRDPQPGLPGAPPRKPPLEFENSDAGRPARSAMA